MTESEITTQGTTTMTEEEITTLRECRAYLVRDWHNEENSIEKAWLGKRIDDLTTIIDNAINQREE